MQIVNIVGAGLAGLSAAITLAKTGIKSRLISLQPSERAGKPFCGYAAWRRLPC